MIQAARQNPRLLLWPVLALALVGAVAGLLRSATYTAETQMIIGKVDPSVAGVSEFVATTQGLGKGYSRVIYAESALDAVARRTGLTHGQIRSRVSAIVNKTAPLIQIKAKGPSAAAAMRLASAEGVAVAQAINRLNRPEPQPAAALAAYRRATARYLELQAAADRLASGPPGAASRPEATRAQADAQAALARKLVAETTYRDSLSTVSDNLVRVLTHPRGASSDRTRKLGFLVYVGAVIGAAIGLVRLRRRMQGPPPRGAALASGGWG
ncbi:MAG: hypothetical protein QOE06_558 [Thermoleophilaceae bacterium]|nr:hypothetical protein [Thermoleophilaceae bacterium]